MKMAIGLPICDNDALGCESMSAIYSKVLNFGKVESYQKNCFINGFPTKQESS